MEFVVLGWPPDGPVVELDYEVFPYAGKFVMTSTGKAVVRDEQLLAAAAFDADRTTETRLRIRYVSVHREYQGQGVGPRLLRFVAERARSRGFRTVWIAVNNPYAYEAAYRAGFEFTGEQTGIAELVCAYEPVGPVDSTRYHEGLDVYRQRELSGAESAFLDTREEMDPPTIVSVPD